MVKPASPPPISEHGPEAPDSAESSLPRAPAASAEEAASQRWLEAHLREQYRDAASEPLPERLVSLIRRLRHLRH